MQCVELRAPRDKSRALVKNRWAVKQLGGGVFHKPVRGDHRVACQMRSPHKTVPLHRLLHARRGFNRAPLRTYSRHHTAVSRRSIRVSAGGHREHRDAAGSIVNAIDHSIGPPPGTVAISQRRHELLADSVRILEQGADDEFMRGKGDRGGQDFGELSSRGSSDEKIEHRGVRHRPREHASLPQARRGPLRGPRRHPPRTP